MKRLPLFVFLLAITLTIPAMADKPSTRIARQAEKNFTEYDFFDALEGFLVAHTDAPDETFLVRRVGDCYRLLGIPEEALLWYKKLQQMGGHDELDLLYHAEVLQQLNMHEAAASKMKEYHTRVPADTRGKRAAANLDYHISLTELDDQVNVEGLKLNNRRSIYAPTQGQELLIIPIATEVEGPWFSHRRNLIKYDLYQTAVDDLYNLVEADPLEGDVNSKLSEGPSCYDPEREILLVTRFLTRRGKPKLDKQGQIRSEIHAFRLNDGKWEPTEHFPFNEDGSSTAYPSLSPDGNTLYFAANRSDSFGGMDLYVSKWDRDEERWGEPINMGADINTEGNEIYPMYGPDGRFSFASDGHPGLGGLDIFFADLRKPQIVVSNPGMPINTPSDDFGLMYIGDQYGYFCSDRHAQAGGDDLFWWESMHEVIEANIVLMDELGNPMYPTRIDIKNLRTEDIGVKSGTRGQFTLQLNGKDTYELQWQHGDENYSMICRPEQTQEGLRYVYHTPGTRTVLADARITSYKESALRKRKVVQEQFADKNITNETAYPADQPESARYLLAQWNQTDEHPAEGSKVHIKNLETGAVTASKVRNGSAEFEVDPRQMHAMMWVDAGGRQLVRYLKPNRYNDGMLDFVDDTACDLAFNNNPTFGENDDPGNILLAALSASIDEGALFEDVAGRFMTLVESGREVTKDERGTRIHVEDVYFGFDRYSISQQERAKLNSVTELISDLSGVTIEIVAHTDSRGSKTYNERLSRLRADATKRALGQIGFNVENVTILWKGESDLVNECEDGVPCDAKKHRMNRRSEVFFIIPTAAYVEKKETPAPATSM